jgi:hypothetical protein
MSAADHTRRDFFKVALGAVAAGHWTRSATAMAAGAADPPGVHGMLVAGEQSVYLSHLPIFGAPHNYQVILEATFAKPGHDPQADYFSDRKRNAKKVYTLEPERFVLTDLAAASPRRSFKANVYRGHFERFASQRAKDAARIGEGVDVNVTRVIHFHKFDPAAAGLPQLEYLLFGKAREIFLAHSITRPPDFDHVLSVETSRAFTDAELRQAIAMVFPGKINQSAQRIKGVAPLSGRPKAGSAAQPPITFKPGKEIYFEEGELAD